MVTLNFNLTKEQLQNYLTNEKEIITTEEKTRCKKVISECITNNDVEGLVRNVTIYLGFNMASYGTPYLIDTICYMYKNNYTIHDRNKAFEELSTKYGCSSQKFQNRMWNAITSADKKGTKYWLYKWFPEYDNRKLSNVYALSLALNELKNIFG